MNGHRGDEGIEDDGRHDDRRWYGEADGVHARRRDGRPESGSDLVHEERERELGQGQWGASPDAGRLPRLAQRGAALFGRQRVRQINDGLYTVGPDLHM